MIDGHSLAEEAELPQSTIEQLPGQQYAGGGEFIPKSLLRSKITWVQTILGFFGVGEIGSQVDASAFDKAKAFFTSPGFLLLGVMACIGLTIYWRWRDHGRGQR